MARRAKKRGKRTIGEPASYAAVLALKARRHLGGLPALQAKAEASNRSGKLKRTSGGNSAFAPAQVAEIAFRHCVRFEGSNLQVVLRSPRYFSLPDGRLGVLIDRFVHPVSRAGRCVVALGKDRPEPLERCAPADPSAEDFPGLPEMNHAEKWIDVQLWKVPGKKARRAIEMLIGEALENQTKSDATTGAPKNLDGWSFNALRQLWINANRIVSEGKSEALTARARATQEAVFAEWSRRGGDGEIDDGYFAWPTTDAPQRGGTIGEVEWVEGDGMLAFLDYHVGSTQGHPAPIRRSILDGVFANRLPPVFARRYLDQWGSPGTAQRLRKMAESIAAFARNFKRRESDKFDQAIGEWEADLEYLHDNYYVGRFRFGWPSTKAD